MKETLETQSFYKDKKILVTGALGTVGEALLRHLETLPVAQVLAMDNRETELHDRSLMKTLPHTRYVYGDIRDNTRMASLVHDVDMVFHLAAIKHVPIAESSPHDAVYTNVTGTQNLIDLVRTNRTPLMLFTSSDKAVSPTNVLGASKLLGERIMSAAQIGNDGVRFASTRFGNVLGSRGSVVPLFHEQIKRGGPLTLTDPSMSRFVMSVDEAAYLVAHSAALTMGGEIWVTKMPVMRMGDLARVMIEILAPQYGHKPSDIEIKVVGARPGEKLYEELMTVEESRLAWESDEYFIIPYYGVTSRDYMDAKRIDRAQSYNSHETKALSHDEIAEFLHTHNLLSKDN